MCCSLKPHFLLSAHASKLLLVTLLICALMTADFPELLYFLWPYVIKQLRFSSSLLSLCSPVLGLLQKGP